MSTLPRQSPVMSAAAAIAARAHPIPNAALDDRLAFVGTSGSGKTYNAGTAIERLLSSGARAVICDPLGVWWGLRMLADGKTPSPHKVVIFGGKHGDMPLSDQHGALIGEAAATMAESCIVDLSDIQTAAGERRFMLDFLRALYRHITGEPVHLVLDEADMWAPQTIRDKEGDANKLFAITERIIRRGRVDGFIPWQITQRPAELSKSVLSMAEGMIAMRLTSPQDRDALDAWISGQADASQAKAFKAGLPKLEKGEGVVWLPGHDVLETRQFPAKATFDSSRAPERGKVKRTVTLKPLDLDALKEKLGKVEAEIKANDPHALKMEVAALRRQLAAKAGGGADLGALLSARDAAFKLGFDQGSARRAEEVAAAYAYGADDMLARGREACELARSRLKPLSAKRVVALPPMPTAPPARTAAAKPPPTPATEGGLPRPQLRVMEAIAFWNALGFERPNRAQIGAVAGYSATGGGLGNCLGALRTLGLVEYPEANCAALTEAGAALAPPVDTATRVRERLASVLSRPEAKVLDALPRDGSAMSREQIGALTDYSPTGGGLGNLLGSLRTLGLIAYPQSNHAAVQAWVWL